MLARPNGEAHIKQRWYLQQKDIRPPRLPSDQDTIRSPSEMRAARVQHIRKSVLEVQDIRFVLNADNRHNELIISAFETFKPSDTAHKDPRTVLDEKEANEPAKEIFQRTKKKDGHRQAELLLTEDDLLMNYDNCGAYKQILETAESSRTQRHWFQEDEVLEAIGEIPKHARRGTVRGRPCVLFEPRTLVFGATDSKNLFCERLALVLGELRQDIGLKIATKVDDVLAMTKHGATDAQMANLSILLMFYHFRVKVHMQGKKAMFWPGTVIHFDGKIINADKMARFADPEQVERHGKCATQLIRACRAGRATLRDLTAVIQQQQYHTDSHWPTGLVLSAVKEFGSQEQKRIRQTWQGNPDHIWDQPISRMTPRVVRDLIELAKPKMVGEHLRLNDRTPAIVADADTSEFATGGQIRDTATGRIQNVRLPLNETDRQRWHTPKEMIGCARVASAALQAYPETRGPKAPQVKVLQIGGDNTACQKNWMKPGPKTSMVDPTVQTHIDARRRLPIQAVQKGKEHMDFKTPCDMIGRWQYHYGEWGTHHLAVEAATSMLHRSITENPTIDLFADKETVQRAAQAAITRWPTDLKRALTRPDAMTYNWATSPELRGLQLYAHPPPSMIPRALQKLRQDEATAIFTIPIFEKKPDWWPIFQEMVREYVIIPWHPSLHIHPAGQTNSDDEDKGWSLITAWLSPTTLTKSHQGSEQQYLQTTMTGMVDINSLLGQTTPPTTIAYWNLDNLSEIVVRSY
jgi:hypothetical protein